MSGAVTGQPVTSAQFRADFPAFADTTSYPDADINLYLNIANGSFPPNRWGQYLNIGIELFVAHFITLDERDVAAVAAGGTPGQFAGTAISKSVGSASVSYDLARSAELDAGHWNLTTFGTRYLRFARMIGSGPVQINGSPPNLFIPIPGW